MRAIALQLHRYVGVTLAVFLLVPSVTGALIAFYVPIDTWLNPEIFVAEPPTPSAPMLDPFEVFDRLKAQMPDAVDLNYVMLDGKPGRTLNYWSDEREVFVNPYTAEIQGTRKFGDIREGRVNWMTFLYVMHFTLAIDEVGRILLGIVALLWVFDSFVGAYLTLPASTRGTGKKPKKGWFARWLPSWLFKTNKLFTLIFTWHRASGLWIFGMLLIFAWSAVVLNLDEVYSPFMNMVMGKAPDAHAGLPELDPPHHALPIPLREAHAHGVRLMAAERERLGFEVLGERYLAWLPDHGAYSYTVESTLDMSERLADTTVVFDEHGRRLGFHGQTGIHPRTTLDSWLIALHFGSWREGGLLYRSFVCLMGVMVALLCISGIWIFTKKLRQRRARAAKDASAAPAEEAAAEATP